ncbi:HNH endonuclease [Dickeya oryzae]|uniref:HNH endonuclease n=1 Tax=Dickeya oryzae TaxID=1240404 RepID=A0AB39J097_9GAMM|nr:HNH endonuclease [Dickeya oryzae]MCA6989516.1 HNH endonuclease [Dickeya oryzae]MCA6996082.1 HNH endonuclease [Dickeya oryzae]
MNWLISANSEVYDHTSSFKDYGSIDWRQGRTKYKVLDIVYIYVTKPTGKIQYKCRVTKVNLSSDEIRNDKEYWKNRDEYQKSLSGFYMRLELIEQIENPNLSLEKLLKHELKAAPQGTKKLDRTPHLLNYIEDYFNNKLEKESLPDEAQSSSDLKEGTIKQVFTKKYERSREARNKCINYHGTICKVCNLDLTLIYGKLANGFIHVHHLIPISEIGEEYIINYKDDLIPVCPNCHAMLHRIQSTEPLQTLKEIVKNNLGKILKVN